MRILLSLSILYIICYICSGVALFLLSGGAKMEQWYFQEFTIITAIGVGYFIATYLLFLLLRASLNNILCFIIYFVIIILLFIPVNALPLMEIEGKKTFALTALLVSSFIAYKNKMKGVLLFMYLGSIGFVAYIITASKNIGNLLALPTLYFYPLGIIAVIHILMTHVIINKYSVDTESTRIT